MKIRVELDPQVVDFVRALAPEPIWSTKRETSSNWKQT